MMVKIASPTDWGFSDYNPVLDLKISSRGWMLGDRQKVGAEVGDQFIAAVRKIEDQLDTQNFKLAHVVSCGASDVTGPNRNGDGWRGSVLSQQMPTYLKYASCYRNHKNKDTDPSYGKPKLAMYDPSRGYGRVLVAYNATDKALKEPRDKVAYEECDALERGQDIMSSHGASIPYDVCVACGNKAPTRKEYCESSKLGGECSLFGCKHGLKKIAEDGRVQYVDNPLNRFYDISTIALVPGPARQADRISYVMPFDMNSKLAAEDGHVVGSNKLAQELGMRVPSRFQIDAMSTPWQKSMIKAALWLTDGRDTAICPEYHGQLPESVTKALRSQDMVKVAAAVQTMAENGQMIGPRTYCKLRGADEATTTLAVQTAKVAAQELYNADRLPEFVSLSPIISEQAFSRDKLAYGAKLPNGCDLDEKTVRSSKIRDSIVHSDFPTSVATADTAEAAKLAAEHVACQILAASVMSNKD